MNLSIRPSSARSFIVPTNVARVSAQSVLHPSDLAPRSAFGSVRIARLPESGDPISGIPPTVPGATPTSQGGVGKAAGKESKGFFQKVGGFFKKVGGFFKTIGLRMGRGIRDGVKSLFWDPVKKNILAPIGHNIVNGVKKLGSLIKKAWPF